MSDLQTLLARCQELGATLTPGPEGKLKVRAPAPLPEELREELRQHKAEVLDLLSRQPPFPCPACGGKVQLAPPDEYVPTRLWACLICDAWGATREGAAYPAVWIGSRGMQ
jgi:TubC N-terminal docking domain